jgi:hypothetical protein
MRWPGASLLEIRPPYFFNADVRNRDFCGQALQGV